MVLKAYTIGDAENGHDIFSFNVPNAGPAQTGNATLVDTIATNPNLGVQNNPPGTQVNPSGEDLEGLGTNPNNGEIVAVSESDFGKVDGVNDKGVTVRNVDAPAGYTVNDLAGSTVRFGDEAGADFKDTNLESTTNTVTLYNIQGSTEAGKVGSSLYTVNNLNDGSGTTLVKANPTAAQTAGTAPTNPGKYADSLAIKPGTSKALAGDFSTDDGDGNQLYKVDVTTGANRGMLSAPIELRLNSLTGALLNVNFDSGLAFSPNGSRLFALTENGVLYEILQFNDDLNVAGLGLADGKAVAKKLFTATNLQNQYNAGTADFEGLAIVDEPAAASASTLAVSDGNSEDEVIYGGAGNDRLFGRGGDDQIFGKEGNDFIWGNRGDDLLRGGLGNDIVKGDTLLDRGTDTFVLATGEGTDTIVDFTIDEDLIGLADGLTYEDLSISQTGTNTTIGFDNETLAVLRGVDASELIAAADNSFVIV
jgi:hypothetical protein